MSDNRTTELLREGLTECGIEWRSGLEGVTFAGDWCFVEYDDGKLAATCEPALTTEQAIAVAAAGDGKHDARFANGAKTLLPCWFCGGEADMAEMTTKCDGMTFFKALCNDCFCPGANIHMWYKTEAEAIVAWNTRASGSHPYELRITGDGSDWGEIMRDAYDDLMASACESCTPEQMGLLADHIRAELGDGMLTADDVLDLIERHSDAAGGNGRDFHNGAYTAIADELNAVNGGKVSGLDVNQGALKEAMR